MWFQRDKIRLGNILALENKVLFGRFSIFFEFFYIIGFRLQLGVVFPVSISTFFLPSVNQISKSA